LSKEKLFSVLGCNAEKIFCVMWIIILCTGYTAENLFYVMGYTAEKLFGVLGCNAEKIFCVMWIIILCNGIHFGNIILCYGIHHGKIILCHAICTLQKNYSVYWDTLGIKS